MITIRKHRFFNGQARCDSVFAIAALALTCGILDIDAQLLSSSNAPARTVTQGVHPNATPAWVVQQRGFHPGYYYWPAYGQTKADAQYIDNLDNFKPKDAEIRKRHAGEAPHPLVRNRAPNLSRFSNVNRHEPANDTNTPLEVVTAPNGVLKGYKKGNTWIRPEEMLWPKCVQESGFHPGYYYWIGQENISDVKYYKTWDEFHKRDIQLNPERPISLPEPAWLTLPKVLLIFVMLFGSVAAMCVMIFSPFMLYDLLLSFFERYSNSGFATRSLVLGLLGFFTAGVTAWLGLIFGIIAIFEIMISQGKLRGNGIALAGMIASIISPGLSLYVAGLLIHAPRNPDFFFFREIADFGSLCFIMFAVIYLLRIAIWMPFSCLLPTLSRKCPSCNKRVGLLYTSSTLIKGTDSHGRATSRGWHHGFICRYCGYKI
jgi:hypothetical protein